MGAFLHFVQDLPHLWGGVLDCPASHVPDGGPVQHPVRPRLHSDEWPLPGTPCQITRFLELGRGELGYISRTFHFNVIQAGHVFQQFLPNGGQRLCFRGRGTAHYSYGDLRGFVPVWFCFNRFIDKNLAVGMRQRVNASISVFLTHRHGNALTRRTITR